MNNFTYSYPMKVYFGENAVQAVMEEYILRYR